MCIRDSAIVEEAERRHTERWQATEGAHEHQRSEIEALRKELAERDRIVKEKEEELAQKDH
eukprot:3417301-Karenia_brevis.AAC.1